MIFFHFEQGNFGVSEFPDMEIFELKKPLKFVNTLSPILEKGCMSKLFMTNYI